MLDRMCLIGLVFVMSGSHWMAVLCPSEDIVEEICNHVYP